MALYELTDEQVIIIKQCTYDAPESVNIVEEIREALSKPVTWANQPNMGYNHFHPELKAAYVAGMSQGEMNASLNNF